MRSYQPIGERTDLQNMGESVVMKSDPYHSGGIVVRRRCFRLRVSTIAVCGRKGIDMESVTMCRCC